jgi:Domain of unknown function (DUF3854)
MTSSSLTTAHYTMLAQESGIIDEVIAERGYRSIDGASGYTELKALGFSKPQATPSTGLLLPLHTTDGQQPLMIYRPDQPQPDSNGRLKKYLLPKGAGVRLDCPPRCQPSLADPTIPLWLTEGQKKADALASHGAVALCLLGVWNFKGKNAVGGITLLADWDYVALNGREVRLVFDSDVVTLLSVRKALERLTEHLSRKGAAVRMVYLPPVAGKKVGVDDYLVAGHSLQDLEALIEAPRPQPQPAPCQIEILDSAPACIRRPLALIDGRTYAAIWVYAKVTKTETTDKAGNLVKLEPPEVTTEQRPFIVRDDGIVFGERGHKSFAELGLDIHLPEIPPQDKLWTAPGVKKYVAGARPDPAAIFRQVVAVVDRFIDFDRSLGSQQTMCELVACYILATWFLDAFTVIGYLWPNGERGSGKTQLLTVIAELAYLGQVILAGGSYASLRDLADYGATLCFDDAENVMDLKRGDPDKRALLLAGNRRGNTIPVKEPVNGRAWRTRHVQTFCPRCFSAIRLPDTVLASRTIILPLIRTANRDKANADPLDYRLWPVPRTELLNNLWALALAYGATLPRYDADVGETATLLGRNLEPWRAILAVAHWLTACSVQGLSQRIEALSQAYQQERPDLEPPDLTAWVIRALCQYASSASSASSTGESRWEFSSKSIQQELVALLENEENGLEPQSATVPRVGRVLGKLRLTQKPRTGPKDPRIWVLKREELRRWLVAYGMPLPDVIFSDTSPPPLAGTAGCAGTAGTRDDIELEKESPTLAPQEANGVHGACGAHTSDAPCPVVGDWVLPLSADGVIISDQDFPPPYLITKIEQHTDGQLYAQFLESGKYWPLAQCERADPPAPVHGLPAVGADEFDEGVVV